VCGPGGGGEEQRLGVVERQGRKGGDPLAQAGRQAKQSPGHHDEWMLEPIRRSCDAYASLLHPR
jgi:hypothetical protein